MLKPHMSSNFCTDSLITCRTLVTTNNTTRSQVTPKQESAALTVLIRLLPHFPLQPHVYPKYQASLKSMILTPGLFFPHNTPRFNTPNTETQVVDPARAPNKPYSIPPAPITQPPSATNSLIPRNNAENRPPRV